MEIFSVKIDMIQEIDHHQASSTLMGDGYFMSEDNSCFVIETKDESNYPILMRIIFTGDDSLQVKIQGEGYTSIHDLKMNVKTMGASFVDNQRLDYQFVLLKFIKKNLDIYLEYDIYSNGTKISKNTFELEVTQKC
ncbi:MAG: hypothetical protein HUJ61_03205 [Bacilli bacterium]|nr:hypothetical protein [Bacilli bacterium]